MTSSFPRVAALGLLSLVACGDDGGAGGGPGAGGAGTGGLGAGGEGAGGEGAGGEGAGGEGAGGEGAGGEGTCPAIPIGGSDVSICGDVGAVVTGLAGDVPCTPGDVSTWPVRVYAFEVTEGSCLRVHVDDVGSSGGSDLFAALVDPGGENLLFDDDVDCSVAADGVCPQGGFLTQSAGTAYVMVGAWESEGCPAGGSTPYRLAVSLGATEIDLTDAELCVGDLLEIIP